MTALVVPVLLICFSSGLCGVLSTNDGVPGTTEEVCKSTLAEVAGKVAKEAELQMRRQGAEGSSKVYGACLTPEQRDELRKSVSGQKPAGQEI